MSVAIRLLIIRGESLDPAETRRLVATLSDAEREEFLKIADPIEADVRSALRATANRLRDAGETVSVSHAGRFGVLAHARSPRIPDASAFTLGVDCEPWSGETSSSETVRLVASSEEFSEWEALPFSERRAAFVRLWTLKEAAFKAGAAPSMKACAVSRGFFETATAGFRSTFLEAAPDMAVAVVVSGVPETEPAVSFDLRETF